MYKEIEQRAEELFHTAFNAKLFRQQLTYYKDINYSEAVDFLKEDPGVEEIKRFLTDVATIAFSPGNIKDLKHLTCTTERKNDGTKGL